MPSHSCEYPIVAVSRDQCAESYRTALQEPVVAWDAFFLLLVTALSSYVL